MQLEKPKARFVTRKEARAEPRTAVLVRFFWKANRDLDFWILDWPVMTVGCLIIQDFRWMRWICSVL